MRRMQFSTITSAITTRISALWRRVRGMNRKQRIIAGAGAVILIVAIMFLKGGGAPTAAPATTVRSVEIKSVAELSSVSSPLAVVGVVSSVSEATVRAESSGQATRVYRALGDNVSAGSIVVELEASSQRAALQQAQGSVDAAVAALAKVEAGTRPEQLAILQSAVEGAKSGAVNTLLSAYSSADNAVRNSADSMIDNPEGTLPTLKFTIPDSQLTSDIQNARTALIAILKRQQSASDTISPSSDLFAELTRMESELRMVREFLDDLNAGLNKAVPTANVTASTIAAYQSTATGARTSINSALASVSAARQTLQTAQKNSEQGVTGAQKEDVALAKASLTQAQGSYAAALANLEKSLIRAPISGTINSFAIKRGDYVAQSTPVLTVANNGALEIVAYITEQDMRDIRAGDKATLEGGATGVVTRVAPAIDPVTKKIEVRIGVSGKSDTLVNGQSVTVTFMRRGAVANTSTAGRITVPISAIKVGSSENSVYTVSAEGTIEAHPVTLGELLGDRVVVSGGLTLDMQIVTDARGLRVGQEVSSE